MIVSKAFAKDSFKWESECKWYTLKDQKNGSNKAFGTYGSFAYKFPIAPV